MSEWHLNADSLRIDDIDSGDGFVVLLPPADEEGILLTAPKPTYPQVGGYIAIGVRLDGAADEDIIWADEYGILDITTGGGGGDATTADNGLTETLNNIQLGGLLLANTAVTVPNGMNMKFDTAVGTSYFRVAGHATLPSTTSVMTDGTITNYLVSGPVSTYMKAVKAGDNSQVMVRNDGSVGQQAYCTIDSTSGATVSTVEVRPQGVTIYSDDIGIIRNKSSVTPLNGQVKPVLDILREMGGVGSTDGSGLSIDLRVVTDNVSSRVANRVISKWTTAADATRTSEFSLTGTNNAIENILLQISGAGIFTLTQGLADHADDAAASAGGIPVNGLYRTGNSPKIRIV